MIKLIKNFQSLLDQKGNLQRFIVGRSFCFPKGDLIELDVVGFEDDVGTKWKASDRYREVSATLQIFTVRNEYHFTFDYDIGKFWTKSN